MLIPKARHCWWTTQVIQHLSSKYQALTSPHYCKKKEKEKKKTFFTTLLCNNHRKILQEEL
jgi:hypothetical protein